MQNPAEDLRFPLTGYDGGLAAPAVPCRCPVCGAWLDSGDDFLFFPRPRPGERPRPARPLPVGCSRCLRRRPVF